MTTTSEPKPLSHGDFVELEKWAAATLQAKRIEIARAERLSGGAVQENWRIDALVDGGRYDGARRWVLRTDAEASLAVSLDRTAEFGVLSAAYAGGVKVAAPVARCEDASIIGSPFLLQSYVVGEGQGRRLVRDPGLADWGPVVARDLGIELAKIHQIRSGHSELGFLPQPMLSPAKSEVARLRNALDSAAEPRPALEYILAWLEDNDPGSDHLTLVHGDFRTGNYLVAEGHLSAILDWEFAHWGDPHEDIGWFTAKCWRFGNDHLPAGGIAKLNDLLDGYRTVGGNAIDISQLAYWQILAAAKWAAIAVLQGDRYRIGGEDSLELALTGLMVSELELEALDGIKALEEQRAAN
ncbi:MAG: phosphotransferase family protein [Alphaproteobacteria bacterium]|nr:phosphotransferase family protein [Alphaproteobacteria bacterium]